PARNVRSNLPRVLRALTRRAIPAPRCARTLGVVARARSAREGAPQRRDVLAGPYGLCGLAPKNAAGGCRACPPLPPPTDRSGQPLPGRGRRPQLHGERDDSL